LQILNLWSAVKYCDYPKSSMTDNMQKRAEIRLEEASQAQEVLARYEGDAGEKLLRKVCLERVLLRNSRRETLKRC
jgi:hypothetical protein